MSLYLRIDQLKNTHLLWLELFLFFDFSYFFTLAIPGATNLIDGLSFGFNGRRALPIATHICGFSDITRGITLNGNYFDSTQA
jgi:hypothetical protein